MPEGPEITILSQYLLSKLKNKSIVEFNVLSGKYLKKPILNLNIFENNQYVIKDINSKGKLLWIELENNNFIMSHLGLTGFWSFKKNKNDRIRITIKNNKNDKICYLCYNDPRNFGNIEIITKIEKLDVKIKSLAIDALKTDFTNEQFEELIKNYLKISPSRKKQNLFLVLMKQNVSDGIVSGLGNYLTPEILYNCKLNPYREIGSLTQIEIHSLAESIKYITKLSYYNNSTGYMTNFGDFIQLHKKRIDDKIYPEYHTNIKLSVTDEFKFSVYQQKKDLLGNDVTPDKEINKGRTTYWVRNVQI